MVCGRLWPRILLQIVCACCWGPMKFPIPLERVVEFLNAQMPQIEVLAVEIKQLRGESVQAVAPRVSGRTAAGSDGTGSRRRRELTRGELLEELPSEEARMVGGRLLAVADGSGAALAWGSRTVSIGAKCSGPIPLLTVARLSLTSEPGWAGVRDLSVGTAYWGQRPLDRKFLDCLEALTRKLAGVDFTEDISDEGGRRWTVPYDVAATNIEFLAGSAPRTGPLAKMYNGANHSARGGTVQWSRNDSDTRQPASSGLRWKRLKAARRLASVSTIGLQLKSTSCSDQSRPHPSGCTLFSPFRGPVIGANHTVVSSLILSHNLTKRRDLLRQGLQGNVTVTHRL